MRIKSLIINQTSLILFIFFCAWPKTQVLAQEEPTQSTIDESFDPFSDYNEYDQESEEEADIHFLRNGRYMTLAFSGGYRLFTGGFSKAYTPNFQYGAEFSYFFNLNLAMTIGYINGDNNVRFNSYSGPNMTTISQPYSGNVNIQSIDLQAKYYFNTDNITKGLADLNPYSFLGTTYNTRSYSLDEILGSTPDVVWGFKFGGGIEMPILKKSAYVGFQLAYRYIQFPDENKGFIQEGEDSNNTKPISPHLDGDLIDLTVLLGINF